MNMSIEVSHLDIHKLESENLEQYVWRLGQAKDSGELNMSWDELAVVINKEIGQEDMPYTASAFRKPYQQARAYYEAGVFDIVTSDSHLEEIKEQRHELEKQRVKMRDERNELNRVIREQARKESYKEQLLRTISEFDCKPLDYDYNKKFNGIVSGDNDIVCTFFDVHTGINIDNFLNKYNEDVLRDRMNKYLDKIFEVQARHGSENIYVILSELVSGIIHTGIRIENNQNLIEQFLTVVNYLSEFLAELSYRFDNVYVFVCPGNHSRVQAKKEDNMRGENMDLLAIPFLSAKMQNFENMKFYENDIESSIAMFNVRGQVVYAVHGDKDSKNNVVQKLTMYTSVKPDIIFMGHLHSNAMVTSYDTKVLQAGCLSGGGDEYCMDKRLRNKAEQMITVINDDGLDCIYDVKFD